MPTIANMPAADVTLDLVDEAGEHLGTLNVNVIVLLATTQSAEFKARHGMFLARNMPTLAQLREKYAPVITARTWADAAEQLRGLYNHIDSAVHAGDDTIER
jgi:hypothetical protein